MHIESLRDQEIRIGSGGFTVAFRHGETIHTESSHKYSIDEIEDLMRGTGFRRAEHWCDRDWAFATGLYMAD